MPIQIDWGARFGLIAEAVVAVVLRHGVAAVTIETVAAEMGVSANTVRRSIRAPDVFTSVALEHLCRASRLAYFSVSQADLDQHGELARLLTQLPTNDDRRAWWTAWTRLVRATTERRRTHGPPLTADRSAVPEPDVPIHRSVEEQQERLGLLVELVARQTGIEVLLLRVVVDGIVAGVLDDRLDAQQVSGRLVAWVRAIAGEPARAVVMPRNAT